MHQDVPWYPHLWTGCAVYWRQQPGVVLDLLYYVIYRDEPFMPRTVPNKLMHVRLLESWLPFAQEANQWYGWNYTAPALESLIVMAAPDLLKAQSPGEARVILWQHHMRNTQKKREHTIGKKDGRSI